MHATVLLGAAFALGAPALKDPPKKETKVVGEWVVESQTNGGRPLRSSAERRYTFTADGTWSINNNGKTVGTVQRAYTLDTRTDPPTIDLRTSKGVRPTYVGIVKVEGDRLTLCYDRGTNERPARFESPADSTVTLIVFKRVKKE